MSIANKPCPVFGVEFEWGCSGLGSGRSKSPNSPSLDRVIPELGYIIGNVVFISRLANTIKSNATEKELYAVADWLHDKRKEVLNAFKDRPTPLPAPPDTPGKKPSARWPFPGAGPGKNSNRADDRQGELFGADPGDSSQESRGVSMGAGVSKMAASARPPSGASDGDARATFESSLQSVRHLRDQRGERPLAGGTLARWAVRLFNNRRKQPVQGPQHETVQGDKESAKDV